MAGWFEGLSVLKWKLVEDLRCSMGTPQNLF